MTTQNNLFLNLRDKNKKPIQEGTMLKLSDGRIGSVVSVNNSPAILFSNEKNGHPYRIFLDNSILSNSIIVEKPEPI